MKKTTAIVILLALLLSGCAESEESSWQAGQEALMKEDYPAAVAAFEKAGDYENAGDLLLYAKAWQALENGEYEEAGAGFRALGTLKDSSLMVSYCSARERDAATQAAYLAEDWNQAVEAAREAVERYAALSFFRDCDTRVESLRETLYAKASEWMSHGDYEAAASGFEALGDWGESLLLQKYCQAAALEEQTSYVEAAECYDEIPEFRDSAARAESARAQAYQAASDLRDHGDYEAASEAFAALGSYRDAEEQRDGVLAMGVRTFLQSGEYSAALQRFAGLADTQLFQKTDLTEAGISEAFLSGFFHSWMNAHAGVMNGFFSRNLLQPYLEPGGELDLLLQAELPDDSVPQNYSFVFYGAEVGESYILDSGFTVAKVHGASSHFEPAGWTETEETLWVLVDSTGGNSIVSAVLPVS